MKNNGLLRLNFLRIYPQSASRKNGAYSKIVKLPGGRFTLATPRDRNGQFEPQLVKKHQNSLADEVERKIISLFALGISYKDIRDHIADMYGMSISNGTLNTVMTQHNLLTLGR